VRDFNYYPHFQDAQVLERVQETLRSFFEDEIMGDYAGGSDCMSSLRSLLPVSSPPSTPPVSRLTTFIPHLQSHANWQTHSISSSMKHTPTQFY
jgi:hypothetical protein